MAREKLSVSLKAECWADLEQVGKALRHEDLEETLEMLRDLAVAALSVTDASRRVVTLRGQVEQSEGDRCPACGTAPSRGVREMGVRLGRDAS